MNTLFLFIKFPLKGEKTNCTVYEQEFIHVQSFQMILE